MKACPRCGSSNDDNYAVCVSCGFDLPGAQGPSAPVVAPGQPSPSRPSPVRRAEVSGLKESSLAPILLIGGIVGLFVIGPLVGPIVWILAAAEKRKVANGELAPSGALTGAFIVGIVDTCILGILILVLIAFFFAALRF